MLFPDPFWIDFRAPGTSKNRNRPIYLLNVAESRLWSGCLFQILEASPRWLKSSFKTALEASPLPLWPEEASRRPPRGLQDASKSPRCSEMAPRGLQESFQDRFWRSLRVNKWSPDQARNGDFYICIFYLTPQVFEPGPSGKWRSPDQAGNAYLVRQLPSNT